MASDYKAIRLDPYEVVERAGWLVASLYADSTHFILELLQNAEDAFRRRDSQPRSRTVKFDLAAHELRVSHYGQPFDEADVKGICDIGKGTKEEDITQIGRFGIGFKSVYRFTDRPEIHSGNEDFAIDRFVWPSAQPPIERDRDQTVFVLPLRDPETNSREIADGLRHINLDTLLFLRQIDSIEWHLPSGEAGTSVRQSTRLDDHVRQVTLIEEVTGRDDADEEWLVFSKAIRGNGGELAGHVEVAFSTKDGCIIPESRSKLVAFFPTDVETNLGLRIQGPYRTTPSRDNVPRSEPWNQHCVEMTGELLVDALLWLRKHEMLGVSVLECLPLDGARFGEDSMFRPLYVKIKEAFRSNRLLPVFDGGFAVVGDIKIARSSDLRDLFTPAMLADVFAADDPIYWLSDDISDRSTPELARYLRDVLDVDEVRPRNVMRRLDSAFLERQSNVWVCRLYEFMSAQGDLHREARGVWPLVRLSDRSHVVAHVGNVVQAYLPDGGQTDFPTVHQEACATAEAKQFLEAIGLTLPDPVDDIIRNVLPKYQGDIDVDDATYAKDVARIIDALQTDSSARRDELVSRLMECEFVRAVDAEDQGWWSTPSEVYFKTDRFASLFDGVEGVLFVDPDLECLRGERVRSMLERCGASRYLRTEAVECTLSADQLREIRRGAGLEAKTWGTLFDQSLRGIQQLLGHMVGLGAAERRARSATLWEALSDVAARTPGAFVGTYEWGYSHERKTAVFEAATVRTLNVTAWVPSSDGNFRVPQDVSFDDLGWRSEPLLQSKIRFRPAEVDLLAEKVDIEADLLYFLKECELTSVAAFRERFGLEAEGDEADDEPSVEDAVAALGVVAPSAPSTADPSAGSDAEHGRDVGGSGGGHQEGGRAQGGRSGGANGGGGHQGGGESSTRVRGAGTFHSYVAVDHEDDSDSNGLAHEDRMALEEAAIERILSQEQTWRRTPRGNEGFDLVQVADGQECKWCEVKAMAGSLGERPATMSHAQFKCAQEHGEAYWLYVVERAGSDEARIVRIQDPAGKAKTFTFDRGWLDVAEVD